MGNKILITGITGNVGSDIAYSLQRLNHPFKAGVRDIEKARKLFGNDIEYVRFDFEDADTYEEALKDVNKVFLMRPPALADAKKQIKPFIDKCAQKKIEHMVFLSLMGIEKNPVPPHYKIEKFILESGIPYTFLRPSFFMQNLNTTHCKDIKERNDIYIPCGRAKLSFIDTRDIGEAGAIALTADKHKNKAYTLTGPEALDYYQAAEIFTRVLGRKITYSNPSPLAFRKEMINRGVKKDFANVMVMLYLTTRFGMAKSTTPELEQLLGRKATTLEQYVKDYAESF
ncbi:MAG: SDR family oxidoreductase [Bacillota bacterium]